MQGFLSERVLLRGSWVTGLVALTSAFLSFWYLGRRRPLRSLSCEESEDILVGEKEKAEEMSEERKEEEEEASSWSEIIGREERNLCRLRLMEQSGAESGIDSGVAASEEGIASSLSDGKTISGASSSSSDSGRGSEAGVELNCEKLLSYVFFIPCRLCGRLVGPRGINIKTLIKQSDCQITLRDPYYTTRKDAQKRKNSRPDLSETPQLCIVEGRQRNIEKCLELIKNQLGLAADFTMEQVNLPAESLWADGTAPGLGLADGTTDGTSVCAVVSPAHIFVQLPGHPSYPFLGTLNEYMNSCYEHTETPSLLRPLEPGVVCVADTSDGQWWRVQVISYDESSDLCDIKFLDYGGFMMISASRLRQIRLDFLSLPFQAIEVYVSNIIPPNSSFEWPEDSGAIMEELLFYKSAKLNLLGVAEDGIPLAHVFVQDSDENEINVNQELVKRQVASWIELTPSHQPSVA